jgi:hypothetical protein
MIAPLRHLRALASTWRGRFIVIFIASQLLLPLHYYFVRRDPHDERFAWRMFSPMRMAQCSPNFKIDGKPFDPNTEFHEAWIEIASRGRFRVIEEMAHRLCASHPNAKVEVSLDCSYVDRSGVPMQPPDAWGGYDMCQVPLL